MPISFESLNFEKYLDHVINYPILFLVRDKKYIKPNGQTFKDFMNAKINYPLLITVEKMALRSYVQSKVGNKCSLM